MNVDQRTHVVAELEALLPRLWRFAVSLTRDGAEADDLVQSTCVRVLEKWAQFRPGTHFDRWAMRIMANLHRSSRRAQRPTASLEESVEANHVASPAPGPDAYAQVTDVLSAIDALPEGQRAVVALVFGEGFAYREAADVLDVPVGTVMSRLHAARKALAHLG